MTRRGLLAVSLPPYRELGAHRLGLKRAAGICFGLRASPCATHLHSLNDPTVTYTWPNAILNSP